MLVLLIDFLIWNKIKFLDLKKLWNWKKEILDFELLVKFFFEKMLQIL